MNLSDVDLNLLKVFEAIYIEKSVTAAAKRLNIAQSSLSNSLKRLRVMFQDDLFLRSKLGMLPTQRAIELEVMISSCLASARHAIKAIQSFDPVVSQRRFVIGGSDFAAFTILPKLIAQLQILAPQVSIETKPIAPSQIVNSLDEGIVDFAISTSKSYPARIFEKYLFEESMMVLMRRNHPCLEGGHSLSLKQYASSQHIYILAKGEGEKIIDNLLKGQSLKRRRYLTVQNFLIVPYIVENTDLVATVSERIAYHCSRESSVEIFPFPAPIETNKFHLVWGADSNSREECVWLMNLISELSGSDHLENQFLGNPAEE